MKKENKTKTASLPKTREIYLAPVMEAIEVEVEKGFAETRSMAAPGDDPTSEADYTW